MSLTATRIALASFFLCLLSGLVLSFAYRPYGDIFKNVEEITGLFPYGWFLRQVHYASGELSVLLVAFHTLLHLVKRRYLAYGTPGWVRLVGALILCFYALFTGFILKGDMEGRFAAEILLSILRAFPFLGDALAGLFVRPGEHLFFLPYLYHCLFLPAAIVWLLRDHIRAWSPDRVSLLTTLWLVSLYALFIPPDQSVSSAMFWEGPVRGPWFFWGTQRLLRTFPAFVAGVCLPVALTLGLLLLPACARRLRGLGHPRAAFWLHTSILLGLLGYGLLTLAEALHL